MIVAACGDRDSSRTAMNRGAFDFLDKPFNFKNQIIIHQSPADKFIGDTIMAAFRVEYHLDLASDAALANLRGLDYTVIGETVNVLARLFNKYIQYHEMVAPLPGMRT